MGWGRRFSRLAGCAVLLAAAVPAAAQPDDEGAPAESSGKDEFERHCALCHGLDGRGSGPLAEAMKVMPSDLTRISARHEGTFPAAKVADVVRNGGGVLGHGSTAMLAWGRYFSERNNPAVGKARIKALTDYIESLQQK